MLGSESILYVYIYTGNGKYLKILLKLYNSSNLKCLINGKDTDNF